MRSSCSLRCVIGYYLQPRPIKANGQGKSVTPSRGQQKPGLVRCHGPRRHELLVPSPFTLSLGPRRGPVYCLSGWKWRKEIPRYTVSCHFSLTYTLWENISSDYGSVEALSFALTSEKKALLWNHSIEKRVSGLRLQRFPPVCAIYQRTEVLRKHGRIPVIAISWINICPQPH